MSIESIDRTDIVTVSEAARAVVLDARAGEVDPTSLSLWLEISGSSAGRFTYDMYFQPTADAGIDDVLQRVGDDLVLVIPSDSVDRLRGARLDLATDGSGMVLINPNEPKRPTASAPLELPAGAAEGPRFELVKAVLEEQVNPSIASHGGFATLVGVVDGTVYLTMGGGCQGCAMSKATLANGIETAIKKAVPEIVHVIDVTDHAVGANPFYK